MMDNQNGGESAASSAPVEGSEVQATDDADDFEINWNEVEDAQDQAAKKEKQQEKKGASVPKTSNASNSNSSKDKETDSEEEDEETDGESDDENSVEDNQEEPKERLIKVKVAGEEYEITEAEAAKAYELAMGARQKFNEAKQLRDQAEAKEKDVSAFLKNLKTVEGVLSLVEYAKIDQKALFKALHAELTMPEDERRWRELERRERALKDKEEEKKKLKESQKLEKETRTYIQKLTLEIGGELKKAGIENNAHNIKLVSRLLLEAQKANTKLTTSGAVTMLKSQIRQFQAEANKQRNDEAKAKVKSTVQPVSNNQQKKTKNGKKIKPMSEFGAANLKDYFDQFEED